MTMRSAPPIIPTFGDESNNQQYTQYFVRRTVNETKANATEGERQVAEPVLLKKCNSRSAPPIIPTFGDESNNQQYTQYFVGGTVNQMKANGAEGERQVAEPIPVQLKSKSATNLMVKRSIENQYSKRTKNTNDEKGFQDGQSKELKADDRMNMKSTNASSNETVNAYEGRLGNSLSSHSPRSFERTIHPNVNPANYMVFGGWEDNPNVPITEVFNKYRKREALPSCEQGQSSPPHTTNSWCSCFSPKKG